MTPDLPTWLAERLERTYATGNWSGKGVLPALADLSLAEAHWRPTPEQHTVAEIALHIAYWCWFVAHGLEPGAVTPPGEEEWRPVPEGAPAWAAVQDELARAHAAVAAAIRRLSPEALREPVAVGSRWTKLDVITDLATHDSYHAAQIFVLRRLHAAQRRA